MSDDVQTGNDTAGTDAEQNQSTTGTDRVYTHEQYAGVQRTLNQRNAEIADLNKQHGTLAEEHKALSERFNAQTNELDGLRRQLADAASKTQTLSDELVTAQQFKMKLDAFNALVADEDFGLTPDASLKMLGLLNDIPAQENPEAMIETLKRFADFGKSVAQEAETNAGAGVTRGSEGNPTLPTTPDAWETFMRNKPPDHPDWDLFREAMFTR